MFQKIMEMKKLKELKIDLLFFSQDNFKQIQGENASVEKLIINFRNINGNKIILNEIQKKFPNLKEFHIYVKSNSYNYNQTSEIDISENDNCKINSFKFSGYKSSSTTTFYIVPFDKLINIEFGRINPSLFNFEKSLPLFTNKCNYIFRSLKSFKLVTNTTDYIPHYLDNFSINAIKNIIDNLDKMPYLETLIIKAFCSIDQKIYMNIIEKLLLSNIKNIEFGMVHGEEYSKNELQSLYKNIDIKKFEKIKIKKYD